MTTLFLTTAAAAVPATAANSLALTTGASILGYAIDSYLFNENPEAEVRQEYGTRLSDVTLTGSSATQDIYRIVGRYKIGGNIIWGTQYREDIVTSSEGQVHRQGPKKGAQRTTTIETEFLYFVSLAIGLCEGPIIGIRNIWADGDLWVPKTNYEIHRGYAEQEPSDIIKRIQGSDYTPGYDELAYFVLEWLPLKDFGDRIPQFQFEVLRWPYGLDLPVHDEDGNITDASRRAFGEVDSVMVNVNGGNFTLADERLFLSHSPIIGDGTDEGPDKTDGTEEDEVELTTYG